MALVGEPELNMFFSSQHGNVAPGLMEWTTGPRILDPSNEICSSSYMTSSDLYSNPQYFFPNSASQNPFDLTDSFHTPKLEPLGNSAEFDYYGPPPSLVSSQGAYHVSGGGSSSFVPHHDVSHPFSSQPLVQQQQQQLHGGQGGGALEEIDGLMKNFELPSQQHQDLEMDPFLFGDLVSLHPQASAPQHAVYGSHASVNLSGLDAGPVVSHQLTRNLMMDEGIRSNQAVLMRNLQDMMYETTSMDTGSDNSTMTFASPSESVMSNNYYSDVGRGHGASPTSKLGISGNMKVGSPSPSQQHQHLAMKQQQQQQQQTVLKKPQHTSGRMSTPGLGGGFSIPSIEQNFRCLPPATGFGPSSSPGGPHSVIQLQNSRFPSHTSQISEQISTGTSVPATGLQLVHFLLACAEAVAENKLHDAEVILVRLRDHVLPDGNPMQRLAAYFEQALSARLKKENGLPRFLGLEAEKSMPQAETLEAFSVYYDCIPIGKFGHLTCNQILLDAVEKDNSIHVLELSIFHGMQWPAFLQALALRGGEVPKLRLSAIGSDAADLRETGEKLHECAKNLRVPFEFCPILCNLEDFKANMVETRRGEVLVVNSFVQFHRILNKAPNAIDRLLGDLRLLNPKVMAFAENDGNHNSNSFLTRFVECLRYYSAVFDAFDASLPPDSPSRMKMEEIFAAQKIRNIIACEGPARVDGHETMKYWHKKMQSAHFSNVPLSNRAGSQAQLLLNLYYSNGYTLNTSECGYLALGWHGMPLMGVSGWQ
ncbi:unnamed protein product [Calypogeia fissa]